jgi:hypothetical protein
MPLVSRVEDKEWLENGSWVDTRDIDRGVHLGQALYKVVSRLRIGHKVSVTRACDDSDTDWIRLDGLHAIMR